MWINFNLNKFRPKSTSIKHLEKFILCLTNCSPLCNRGQPCMPEIPHVNAANNSKYIHMAIYFPTSLLKKHKTDKWLYLIGFIWARRGALKVKQDKVRVKSRAFRIKSRKWHTGQRWAPVWSTNEDRMTKHQQNLRKQIAYFFQGFCCFTSVDDHSILRRFLAISGWVSVFDGRSLCVVQREWRPAAVATTMGPFLNDRCKLFTCHGNYVGSQGIVEPVGVKGWGAQGIACVTTPWFAYCTSEWCLQTGLRFLLWMENSTGVRSHNGMPGRHMLE